MRPAITGARALPSSRVIPSIRVWMHQNFAATGRPSFHLNCGTATLRLHSLFRVSQYGDRLDVAGLREEVEHV